MANYQLVMIYLPIGSRQDQTNVFNALDYQLDYRCLSAGERIANQDRVVPLRAG